MLRYPSLSWEGKKALFCEWIHPWNIRMDTGTPEMERDGAQQCTPPMNDQRKVLEGYQKVKNLPPCCPALRAAALSRLWQQQGLPGITGHTAHCSQLLLFMGMATDNQVCSCARPGQPCCHPGQHTPGSASFAFSMTHTLIISIPGKKPKHQISC